MRNNQLAHTLFRLIVLTGLQIFLLLLLYKAIPVHKHQRVLKFNLISGKSEHPYGRIFFVELLNGKVITKFNLSGNPEVDNKILNKVDLETRRLNTKNDTLHVLRVHFTPENTYGQFERLVNIVHIELTWRYILLDDGFYIFGNPKEDATPNIDSSKITPSISL